MKIIKFQKKNKFFFKFIKLQQSSDDDDSTFRKNHLSGIRPIRLTHPIAKPLESSITIDDTHRFFFLENSCLN